MNKYIITNETEALFEEFDIYGNSYTRIIEGENSFVVKLSLRKDF